MSALAIILTVIAVAGIVAVRHADRRARHDELEQLRRRLSARRIGQTVRVDDDWWTR